ncbi:MAG: gamma-glutamyltransferase [Bdellovibrionales bacterium]|nr:gamma-glutamyltransferase [Bdellovibrionales bacterium]
MRKVIFLSIIILFNLKAYAIPAHYSKLAMTGASKPALEIGNDISKKGGNVVDVTVAIGLAMSVTNPFNASLGGGGFALIKMDKAPVRALDFREVAPLKTHPKYYLENKERSSTDGAHAIGVPGFVAGLQAMHKLYGKLKWKTLVEPAIKLAEQGFAVSGEWVEKTQRTKEKFNEYGHKYFFKNKDASYKPAEVMKQPQLARALKLIQKDASSFYSGAIAKDIVNTVKNLGGVLSEEDFKNYKVRWHKPLNFNFKGYKLYSMPPPSSGGVVMVSALKLIEELKLSKLPARSYDEYHMLAEVLKASYRGRSELADPDFAKNPIEELLSDKYIKSLAKKISVKKVANFKPVKINVKESSETTHYNVMDTNGNAVSLTVTLNGSYGSGVVSKDFGISLNNEMDDFTTKPGEPNMFGLIQGQSNNVEPGKRPLSSMTPTLLLKDDKVKMTIGAPGGPRIISSVLQVIYRNLYRDLDMDQSIQALRVHHQFLPKTTYIDKHKASPELIKNLKARGHNVEESWMARVNAIRLDDKNWLEAAFDSRGEGHYAGH